VRPVLERVASVRDVQYVDNQLVPHAHADGVPGVQGGRARHAPPLDAWQRHGSPTTRVMIVPGATMAVAGGQRRDLGGWLCSAVGVGVVVRGLTNPEWSRLTGVRAWRHAVDLQRIITIAAPVEQRVPALGVL
jgi:hypothetical protein